MSYLERCPRCRCTLTSALHRCFDTPVAASADSLAVTTPTQGMTAEDAASVMGELQECAIYHDDDALLPIALTNRVLATYALCEQLADMLKREMSVRNGLLAANASLKDTIEGMSANALKVEGEVAMLQWIADQLVSRTAQELMRTLAPIDATRTPTGENNG